MEPGKSTGIMICLGEFQKCFEVHEADLTCAKLVIVPDSLLHSLWLSTEAHM